MLAYGVTPDAQVHVKPTAFVCAIFEGVGAQSALEGLAGVANGEGDGVDKNLVFGVIVGPTVLLEQLVLEKGEFCGLEGLWGILLLEYAANKILPEFGQGFQRNSERLAEGVGRSFFVFGGKSPGDEFGVVGFIPIGTGAVCNFNGFFGDFLSFFLWSLP